MTRASQVDRAALMLAAVALLVAGLWHQQHPLEGPADGARSVGGQAPASSSTGLGSAASLGAEVPAGRHTNAVQALGERMSTSSGKSLAQTTPMPVRRVATSPVGARHTVARAGAGASPRRLPPGGKPTSSLVATARTSLRVYSKPGGRAVSTLAAHTPLGSRRVLLVHSTKGAWTRVYLPVRPNGSTGWVRSSSVALSRDAYAIVVKRATHTLTLTRGGRRVAVFPVAVGKRSTPTPTGRFFVTDVILIRNPYGAYGPAALGLSGHSNVLTRFGSGDGVLGIHGTNEPWSVGRSASHGCVRMRNRDVLALVRIAPTGTPVTIS